jgi:hypothetical protein
MFKHKLKVLGFIPILAILLLLGFTTPSRAAQFENGDYTLEESEIIEENLYVKGGSVDIVGVVDGDLIVSGETVNISGTVTGDLYTAAATVNLSGNVYGSAFLAGQDIEVSGSVARNSYIAAMLSDVSGSIGKDLLVFAANSTVPGKVTEDVRIFASKSTVSGMIQGEATVNAATSTINPEVVEGKVYENIDNENEETTTQPLRRNKVGNLLTESLLEVNIFTTLIGFVAMYIVGIVLIYLAPVKTIQIEEKVTGSFQNFLFSFLIGLGTFVILPLPLIILAITLIGAPLAILIIGILIFAAIFGRIWVESAIGHKILSTTDKEDPQRLLSLLIGRGLTTIVNFIPIVRGIYKFVLSATAVGAIIRMKYDAFKTKKVKKK